MVGNTVRPLDARTVGPLSQFSSYRARALVRGSVVQNTLMVDKEFCKCVDGGLGRSIMCRKDGPVKGINISSSKDKALFFLKRRGPGSPSKSSAGPQGMVPYL